MITYPGGGHGLYRVWRRHVGRMVFILFGACNSNPNPPHDPKTPKTVMRITIVPLLEQHDV